jgi:hypothetical protein
MNPEPETLNHQPLPISHAESGPDGDRPCRLSLAAKSSFCGTNPICCKVLEIKAISHSERFGSHQNDPNLPLSASYNVQTQLNTTKYNHIQPNQ